MRNQLVVVVGATGKQGRSVIKSLTDKGYRVRALARSPKKAKALFKNDSVEIFKGDLKEKESLRNLFRNADGLFFALPYSKDSLEYGKTLLDVAKESELNHVVYSSVGGADRSSKVEHFGYKKEIEDHLRQIGKPYTIFRPVGYMDEFAHPKSIRAVTGMLSLYIAKDKKFQLISLQDIGAFVEVAFSNSMKYLGKEIEIAGDELTLNEVFEKIEKVKNVKLAPMKLPKLITFILPKVMTQMFTFYAEDGWQADLKTLKEDNPDLLSFEEWLKTTNAYK